MPKTDKHLLIVESPAKIKTLSKFLGKDYKILSTFGHIKDLPPKKLGVEFNEKTGKIKLDYTPLKDKAKTIKEIVSAAKQTGDVFLASDPDREGEIISWHVKQEVEKVVDKSKIYRITFNEITKPAVTKAIENKGKVDVLKVNAQQARRVLDRWVGYEVSPILWRKLQKGLSAGRVQSVALLVICNREEEILNFKPEEYWSIHGTFNKNKASLIAELVKINNKAFKLTNKEQSEKTVADLKKQNYSVTDIQVKKRIKKPVAPFMTSSLQQASFNQLHFSVKKTMDIAQKLYEGLPLSESHPEALITYMRTDSLRLSETALNDGRGFIKENFGNKYLSKTANVYEKSKSQDAHEAIRPINVNVTPEIANRYLPKDAAKLYGLIWKRFVASQMTPAEYQQRQVNIEGGKYLFRITGSTLIFDGFLKVYLVEDEDDKKTVIIPKEITKSTILNLKVVDPKQHFTQPPPRYTEGSLVKELEKQDVGRPSTYQTILSTIQKRDYTTVDKKKFMPTELGMTVNKMLTANLSDIINVKFTAKMEEDLDKIASGDVKRDDVLVKFYKKFKKDLKTFAGAETGREPVLTKLKCPKCGKPLAIRFGKAGRFLGCTEFPICEFTANFKEKEDGSLEILKPEKPMVSDIKCPNCGKKLIQKMGRFGPFLACPGYPECKYIHQEKLKTKCPECGGEIVKRKSARGTFWGCSNYPKCKFAIFGEVIEKPCPKCKTPYLLITKDKDGKVTYKCNNKECNYSEEVKESAES
ncbi:type I DNA topoisomerase [Candidatus Babeliales bacterium]|nr:type I DNA topoisomerase [Candidatus Babeliales bacterium]